MHHFRDFKGRGMEVRYGHHRQPPQNKQLSLHEEGLLTLTPDAR